MAEEVARTLSRARDDSNRLRMATATTATDVEEHLGGTATGADRAMIASLREAETAAERTSRAIDDALLELQRALARL